MVTEELKSNKLSVFEAHNTLQKKIGHSFIETLQEAIIDSKDFVLVWTQNAVSSDWVKKEYETFINKCNIAVRENRRIIIYVTKEEDIKLLPPFLADYQSCKSLKDLVYNNKIYSLNQKIKDKNRDYKKIFFYSTY